MPKILSDNEISCFRDKLCDLALEAFAQRGVEGITLRGLATSVGCSRTTPYRYFKNKADILAALRQREFSSLAQSLESAVCHDSDESQWLVILTSQYLRFAIENPVSYRVMYEVDQEDAHRYPELMKQIERSGQPIRDRVKAAVAAGVMYGDPINIAFTLWAGLHGLISLHLSNMLGNERTINELAEVMVRSLGRAVSIETAAKSPARRVKQTQLLKPIKF
jgi:AcrR family transcriptional regulator